MTDANNIRKYMKLLEASIDYVGPKGSDTISYSAHGEGNKITKVVANLKSYDSGRYTNLGRNLLKIEQLTKDINELKAATKDEARELVADLFHAEDEAYTRVVETVSFTFELSKKPKETETYKYAKILEELQTHLTPELIQVLTALKSKHRSTVQKAASLSATDKAATTESLSEGVLDNLKGFFKKLAQEIKSWGIHYDSKLDALKDEAGLSESLEEGWAEDRQAFYQEICAAMREKPSDEMIGAIEASCVTSDEWARDKFDCMNRIRAAREELHDYTMGLEEADESELQVNQLVKINAPRSSAHGEYGHIESIDPDEGYRVILYGTGYWAYYTADELEPASQEDADKFHRQPFAESKECEHEWVEAVDDEGQLVEPAYDVCVNCGEERH